MLNSNVVTIFEAGLTPQIYPKMQYRLFIHPQGNFNFLTLALTHSLSQGQLDTCLIIAINSPPANLRVFRNIFIGTERALKRPMTNDNQSHPYHPVRHKALNVSVFVLDFVFVFFGHEW